MPVDATCGMLLRQPDKQLVQNRAATCGVMTTELLTASSIDQIRFLKPDFYDEYGCGAYPFRVDLRGLAEQRDRAESSSDTELLVELAENYTDFGMHERAVNAYNRARELGRDDFEIWHALAGSYRSAGMLDGAIYAHEEALSREAPNDYWWGTPEQLGICLWKVNRHEEALPFFRQAVDRDPKNLMTWCIIHAACDLLNDIDGKAEAQQKLVALSDSGSHYRMVAQGYEAITKTEKAIELYKEATREDQYPILPWSNLGKCCLSLSRIHESTHAFEQCLLCDPIPDRANPHPPAWTHLSYLYGVQGEYDKSIHAANSALSYWKNNGTALGNAGASHLALGDVAKAIECLENARRLRPDRRRCM